MDVHRYESKVILVVIHKLTERAISGELVVSELHHFLAAVYQSMGCFPVACHGLEELQRVTLGKPLLEEVDGFTDGSDKGISQYLLLDVLISLDHAGKTALALLVTTHTEKLGAVGCGRCGRKAEDVFPCCDELLYDLR